MYGCREERDRLAFFTHVKSIYLSVNQIYKYHFFKLLMIKRSILNLGNYLNISKKSGFFALRMW